MEENQNLMDEKTMLLNKGLGIALVLLGVYGLFYAYKIYKNK